MSRGPRANLAGRAWGDDDEGCNVLHVDMDAFFALVELARRPELHGKPVIVGGMERGVVLSATYEARAFGVRSAMPMAAAMRLCPQAIVVRPEHGLYHEVSRGVMEILRDVTSLVEQLSVDEAFLDVRGARRRLGPPVAIAESIRERVARTFGITCSVGIASTKFVAKLASVHAKPDGLLLVPQNATLAFLRSLPVGALWGVGERTEEQLARFGITTVAQLADSDKLILQGAIGRASGARLHDLAWGRDPRPVEPTRVEKSLGAESTFDHDRSDLAEVEARLLGLADHVAERLRRHHQVGRVVALKVRTSDFRTLSRSRTLASPTDVGRQIYLAARELLAGVDLRGLPVRLVGVRLEGLSAREGAHVQATLDEAADGSIERRRAAEATMDMVRERFGAAAIGPGASRLATRVRQATTPAGT
ncbi:DNA polymerase IV [Sanguibacter sp. A247]|uniref:DNA polymerase IV n=1 Tax=unclassified Sanguibacter TaxID=2645534 RepID=UPI003FD6F607